MEQKQGNLVGNMSLEKFNKFIKTTRPKSASDRFMKKKIVQTPITKTIMEDDLSEVPNEKDDLFEELFKEEEEECVSEVVAEKAVAKKVKIDIPSEKTKPKKPRAKKKATPTTDETLLSVVSSLTKTIENINSRLENLEVKQAPQLPPQQPVIHVHMPSPAKIKREIQRDKNGMITGIIDKPEEPTDA